MRYFEFLKLVFALAILSIVTYGKRLAGTDLREYLESCYNERGENDSGNDCQV